MRIVYVAHGKETTNSELHSLMKKKYSELLFTANRYLPDIIFFTIEK